MSSLSTWINWIWSVYCIQTVILVSYAAVTTKSRHPEKHFTQDMELLGKEVTCDNDLQTIQTDNIYPAETWTCRNIRIDNLTLHYESGFGRSDRQDSKTKGSSLRAPIFSGRNDISQICKLLLEAHSVVNKTLWAAYALDTALDKTVQPRAMLNITDTGDYEWTTISNTKKFTRTLKCMLTSEDR